MSLELLSLIFAGLTFTVIAATAVAAIVQLRHLRASNQMNALLALMQLWESPEMQRYFQYTFSELPKKLKDPEFLAVYGGGSALSRSDHPELLVADYWEQIGAFAKHGLFDEASWLDIASSQVLRSWQVLKPIIAVRRKNAGQAAFENFEYLAVRAELWSRRYPDGNWPRGLPRMADLDKG